MGSNQKQPHALVISFPAQGHINPMLKLAKILHSKGFLITFVNTEFNHQRLLRSLGSNVICGLPSFRFETIPDGLPLPENLDDTQDIPSLCRSIEETCLGPFKSLIAKLGALYTPVTCIVADAMMSFTMNAARELDVPEILVWTSGAGSMICVYDQYPYLLKKGLMPLKDSSFLTNGYLDTIIDCIPSCLSGMRLKDIPPCIRMINPGDDYMVKFICLQVERAKTSSAIIFNTFDELDRDILDTISATYPPCYGVGPFNLLEKTIVDESLESIQSNLWKEDQGCLKWLDLKTSSSVIYVNFGSIAVMTSQQLIEFAWGLAKSGHSFLWIIRPDIVIGESAVLPCDFATETRERGYFASWCPQEQVLNHPSVGGFLTHSGWNSTIESISSGVPMICWPVFAEQQTNCWSSCNKWGVGMEIDNNVKSDEVAKLVIELMNGEKGKEMRKKAIDWKNKAEESCVVPSGSSIANLDKVIHLLQTSSK
ncbi:putative 7-deoxyloganetin glucosyltransferase [Helianthus annuus]|nr:putative 7-deoxyloganetin glucosyltransferase [Helianthus annuus]